MLRWILLVTACLLLATSCLTWLRAPTVGTWKAAIVVGEYGHVLVVVPLVLAGVVGWTSRAGISMVGGVTWLILGLTMASLLRPVVVARGLSMDLRDRLAVAFGRTTLDREPLSLRTLLVPEAVTDVPVETRRFTPSGSTEPLDVDVYRANRPDGALAPCVVMIHGGGWDGGDRKQLAAQNHRLARRGYAVAAISYRLAPANVWPAQYEDVVATLNYLAREAVELGIDRTRLVLFGRSAGGQLATAVAYRSGNPAIRGVAAFYAPHDLHFAWSMTKERDVLDSFKLMRQYLGGSPEERKESFDGASAYLWANPRVPPTLLVHGQIDSLVWHRQSERLAERLATEGVPHLFLSLPWATHAFDFNASGPGGQLSFYALDAFLAAVTR